MKQDKTPPLIQQLLQEQAAAVTEENIERMVLSDEQNARPTYRERYSAGTYTLAEKYKLNRLFKS